MYRNLKRVGECVVCTTYFMSVLALKPQYVFRGQWKAGVTLQGLWEHHSKPLFHAVINEMANSGGVAKDKLFMRPIIIYAVWLHDKH